MNFLYFKLEAAFLFFLCAFIPSIQAADHLQPVTGFESAEEVFDDVSRKALYDYQDDASGLIEQIWDPDASQWVSLESWRDIYDGDREIEVVDSHGNIFELTLLDPFFIEENRHGESFTTAHDQSENGSCLVDSESGAITSSSMVTSALTSFKEKASYTNYMQNNWDQTAESFFGKGFLHFSGYYSHPIESGRSSFGQEVSDKVRITLINGILNSRSDLEEALKLFSSTHGNMPIHYIYHPTQGWTKDILSSTLSKFGYTSSYARLLAQKWKELIDEMGGIGQGGKIIHYAHSIGATDTYVARNLLKPEEQRMIHVVTLGSPTMIPKESGFASVVNYVSRRDGVCLLDPIGYARGYFYEDSHIEMTGSLVGIPLIEHTLSSEGYRQVIQKLGKQFVDTYH